MRGRITSARKALWALGLLFVLLSGAVAHHHDAFATDAPGCPACELRQTTPIAPAPPVSIAAPPAAPHVAPAEQAAPAPRPRAPLTEAPKTSPPV